MKKPNLGTDKLTVLFSISDPDGGWAQRWEALQVGNSGTVIQTVHELTNRDGSTEMAVNLLWVPGAKIVDDATNGGKTLG